MLPLFIYVVATLRASHTKHDLNSEYNLTPISKVVDVYIFIAQLGECWRTGATG